MDTVRRYKMYQVDKLSNYSVVEYWKTLIAANLLEHRLFDTNRPNLKDVEEMLDFKGNLCYIMYDEKLQRVCADTMLNNFSGLVAQVHFSMHPEYFGKETVAIAKEGVEQHFMTRIIKTKETISTLFGITPTYNSMAIRFIKKVGFKPICIFDNACYLAKTNSHCDGLLTRLQSKELYNGG